MQIIPVIDIRNGIAVRAVAGERAGYRPLESRLTTSIEPAEVLKALQNEFGCGVCYVADLDGIEGRNTNHCALAEMARTGVRILLDAGIESVDAAEQLLDLGVAQIIVSSESLPKISRLARFLQVCGPRSVVFSVDLKHGQLMSVDPSTKDLGPLELVSAVVGQGIAQLLVLDLASVGTGTGIPTLNLCKEIKRQWPELTVISGGGVTSRNCLESARQAGLDGLLIASALHDGRLTTGDLQSRPL